MVWYKSNFAEAIGIGILFAGIGTCDYLTCRGCMTIKEVSDRIEHPAIIQQQVIGNEQPDVYIEKDGVNYYSHIDGQPLEDFVRTHYRMPQPVGEQ